MQFLKNFLESSVSRKIKKSRSVTVSFTGGLGAQILSAAIYYYYQDMGYCVHSDMKYFDSDPYIVTPGNSGELSHWKWELNSYGINMEDLNPTLKTYRSPPVLHDGLNKFKIGIEALNTKNIISKFDLTKSDERSHNYRNVDMFGQKYMCLHIRRGDYLNVASHMINNDVLENIATKFSSLIDRILILSDSPIDHKDLPIIRSIFNDRINIIDADPDPILAHSLMRNSAILICSNSQFSLTAGMLSRNIKIVPKIWFGNNEKKLNGVVDSLSEFSII